MPRINAHTIDEPAIVGRIKAKDESAFQELFNRYRPTVRSLIFRTLGRHNESEDIAQQVFAKFYFSIGAFDQRCALSTWIHRLTINECFSYLRKTRIRKLLYESDFLAEESFGIAANSAAVDSQPRLDAGMEQRDLVKKLLERLPDNERRLLFLKEAAGYTIEELSKMTRTPENTVKVKLFRMRRDLAKTAERLATKRPLRRAA